MNQQLQDFYSHLNDSVITTNDFAKGTRFRKREKVAQFAYCGLNRVYRSYLSFDLDYPGAGRKFEELHIPTPSIVTTNRANGHCHYLYRLITPVAFHQGGRSKPQNFFKAIEQEMTLKLKADPAFTHTLTKNPLHERWIVESFSGRYHLSDFTEYFDLPSRKITPALLETCSVRGRNDELFHTLRYWAYKAVQAATSEDALFQSALQQATLINATFSKPLDLAEIKHTAKATSRWVWKHRHELNTRPKVLHFTTENATERMQAGATFTNEKRRGKSLTIVRDACAELLPIYGAELTPRILAVHTHLNIKTIRKYLFQI